jgi:OmpA family
MYIRTSEGLGRLPTSYLYRTSEGRATNRGAAIGFEHPAPPCGTSCGLHGFGEPAVAAGPKADLVFDKFEFGLSLVPAAHKPAIDALADRIVTIARQGPGPLGTVRLVGHTDYIDAEKYNQALGMMRAKAVRGALATALESRMRGVTSRIEIVPESRGELQPVTTDKSAAGRALNRRVEVFVSLTSPVPPPLPPKKPKIPGVTEPWPTTDTPPDEPSSSDITRIINTYVPTGRRCVNPYQEIVKWLRKRFDSLLRRSPIPKRYHNQIRQLAENYARSRRDWVIDKGLDELDLRGGPRHAAKQLIIYAVENACL